jgi:WD40 repeat protein
VRIRVTAHAGAVSAVSWADHGKVVVSAGRDGAIRTWDAATGARRGELRSEPAAVKQISSDADGEMGLIVTEKGIAWRWSADPRTGAVVMNAVASRVGVGAVSADGQSVILAMTDGRVAIGPLEGHRRFEPGTHIAVFTAQLSGDGALALTASEVGSGSVTRVSNGKSNSALRQGIPSRDGSKGALRGDLRRRRQGVPLPARWPRPCPVARRSAAAGK